MPLFILLFIVTSLSSVKASDDLILEDVISDTSIGVKKYKGADELVNSIDRDPFYRLLESLDDKGGSITDYELSYFTLVGIVWDVSKPFALFKAPKDKTYVVRAGQKIGRNNGVVGSIEEGKVIIKEVFTDINNNKIDKITVKRVGG